MACARRGLDRRREREEGRWKKQRSCTRRRVDQAERIHNSIRDNFLNYKMISLMFASMPDYCTILHKEYPKVPLHVIARVDLPYRIEEVLVLPWKDYLARIPEILG